LYIFITSKEVFRTSLYGQASVMVALIEVVAWDLQRVIQGSSLIFFQTWASLSSVNNQEAAADLLVNTTNILVIIKFITSTRLLHTWGQKVK
jgi:hypothetical protein